MTKKLKYVKETVIANKLTSFRYIKGVTQTWKSDLEAKETLFQNLKKMRDQSLCQEQEIENIRRRLVIFQ